MDFLSQIFPETPALKPLQIAECQATGVDVKVITSLHGTIEPTSETSGAGAVAKPIRRQKSPLGNPVKTMGKPYENHMLTIIKFII